MKVSKSIIYFAGSERDETTSFAFYIALKQLSHKGSIHNYKSIQNRLRSRINISDSQFRILLNQCIEKGYVKIENKHIVIKSQQKIFKELKAKYPQCFIKVGHKKSYLTETTNYKLIKYWLKGAILHNNGIQQEYNKLTSIERKIKSYNTTSAPEYIKFAMSRKRISWHFNFKSKSSAGYLIKKLMKLDYVWNNERFTTRLRPVSWLEYKIRYIGNGLYFFTNGYLWRNEANLITIPNGCYCGSKKEITI